MNLKFSVSMCVYDGDKAEHFQEALESVYNQTRFPDEVVLVVDGPVHKSINDVIVEYEQRYSLSVFRLKKNTGHGNARREGFSRCSFDYVAIADADDINVSTRFEKQLACFADNPSLSAVSSYCYHFVGTIDNIINEETIPTEDIKIKRFLKSRCPICQPSVMLKKSAVIRAGGYLDWYHAEDYYLWIRMFLNGATFQNIPESLVYMRTTEEQMLRRGGYRYYRSLKKLYEYMLKKNIIGFPRYCMNVMSRFIVQVLLPSKVRAIVRRMVQ